MSYSHSDIACHSVLKNKKLKEVKPKFLLDKTSNLAVIQGNTTKFQVLTGFVLRFHAHKLFLFKKVQQAILEWLYVRNSIKNTKSNYIKLSQNCHRKNVAQIYWQHFFIFYGPIESILFWSLYQTIFPLGERQCQELLNFDSSVARSCSMFTCNCVATVQFPQFLYSELSKFKSSWHCVSPRWKIVWDRHQ